MLYRAIAEGDETLAALALDRGASPDGADLRRGPPLAAAAARGRLSLVRLLLAHGADVNRRGLREELSALHQAASFEQAEIARCLLDAGAEVDQREDEGATPLMYAAARGDLRTVEILLARGADPSAKDKDGWTAWDWAVDKENPEIADLLAQAGGRPG